MREWETDNYFNARRPSYSMRSIVWGILVLLLLASCGPAAPPASPSAAERPTAAEAPQERLTITSIAFVHEGTIPTTYTCDGRNINPPLQISGIPAGTESLALIVEDPDAPSGIWVHWVLWNIPPTEEIRENSIPGVQGINERGLWDYSGPCPPLLEEHRYFFLLYALNTTLGLPPTASKAELKNAMEGHVLAKAGLIGKYQR